MKVKCIEDSGTDLTDGCIYELTKTLDYDRYEIKTPDGLRTYFQARFEIVEENELFDKVHQEIIKFNRSGDKEVTLSNGVIIKNVDEKDYKDPSWWNMVDEVNRILCSEKDQLKPKVVIIKSQEDIEEHFGKGNKLFKYQEEAMKEMNTNFKENNPEENLHKKQHNKASIFIGDQEVF